MLRHAPSGLRGMLLISLSVAEVLFHFGTFSCFGMQITSSLQSSYVALTLRATFLTNRIARLDYPSFKDKKFHARMLVGVVVSYSVDLFVRKPAPKQFEIRKASQKIVR